MVIEKRKVSKQASSQFYHRKLARAGSTRYLAVGKILPSSWSFVQVEVKGLTDKECLLKISKLA